MPVIRQLEILNFRVVRQLKWSPSPGLNCLIGPGDTGKSTVLVILTRHLRTAFVS